MKYEELIKTVMHRANLSSRLEAQDALRATLETLSEHLTPSLLTRGVRIVALLHCGKNRSLRRINSEN